MRYLTHFIIISLLCSLAVLSGCSTGRSAFSKGEKFEAEGNYEDAMYSYAEAFRKEPDAGEYRANFFKARTKASEKRYKMGMEQFERGDYVGAVAEFQTAYGMDPTQDKYKQQMDVANRLKDAQLAYMEGQEFEKGNKLKDANRAYLVAVELSQENKDYKAALARVNLQRKSKLEGFELSLKSSKPITLKFKDAKIKDVFTIITQLTGINFIFDEGIKDQPISIYLENATFQQTMDLLTNMNKLHMKVLNESTVLVYPKTPEKSKQYEDLTLRTFHLSYMDAKKAVNLIRTMLQVKKIHVNEESNSLVVRDSSDVIDVIEKILDANDVPDPEVVLEVEVIEISESNNQTVGLLLSKYAVQVGAFSPSNQLMSETLTGAAIVTKDASGNTINQNSVGIDNLVKAFSMKGFGGYVTVPNATYNFGKTLTNGEVLSNPKIRVKNKEKAKFNVGTRLPIVTTTLNGTTSQANVQYVDVGVKLNAEPNIQLNNEIIIKLSLEVSQQIGGTQTVSGASVVTIGTRNLDTVLSLKDGETSIIGGLKEFRQSDSKDKIYLLSDIPLIGPLFTNNGSNKGKTELILAITPRLVRSVTVPQNSLMSFSSGKEDDPSLARPMASFEQEPVYEVTPKSTAGKPAPAKPVQKPAPAATAPAPVKPVETAIPESSKAGVSINPAEATPPSPARPETKGVTASPVTAVPAAPGVPTPDAVTPPPPVEVLPAPVKPPVVPVPAKRGLVQISAPAGIAVGQQFYADIKAGDVQDLAAAPFVLTYNPALVEFVMATEGTFLKKGGKPTVFSFSSNAAGTLTVKLERSPNSGGVSGNGTLVSALFRAKSKGTASFGFSSVNFTSSEGKPLEMLPFSTAVDVR